MSIIIFLIILSALVIVHEVGHFSVAKYFGIRVDEFGLGYPPKAKKLFKWKGTDFTLNWLPFGGFVKIFGENPTEESHLETKFPSEIGNLVSKLPSDNFQSKNRGIQAAVLFAGVFFNFIFAWVLISLGLMTGLPAPAGLSLPVENPQTVLTVVLPGSPAAEAGLKSGDTLISLSRNVEARLPQNSTIVISPEEASNFIAESFEPLTFTVKRGENIYEKVVTPREGILADKPAVGISMETIGTVELPAHLAILNGLKITWELTVMTAKALSSFLSQAFIGEADLSSVTGPVGLVGMVGDVKELGFGYLLSFTAIISINLSLINLLPFPALDGGRLLFVGIEALTRRPIPVKVFNALNASGFALLILLMILITIRDVRNIF
jgi:regulator of sigma E protease